MTDRSCHATFQGRDAGAFDVDVEAEVEVFVVDEVVALATDVALSEVVVCAPSLTHSQPMETALAATTGYNTELLTSNSTGGFGLVAALVLVLVDVASASVAVDICSCQYQIKIATPRNERKMSRVRSFVSKNLLVSLIGNATRDNYFMMCS